MGRFEDFHEYRRTMNRRILGSAGAEPGSPASGAEPKPRAEGTLVTKRFFRLDGQTYEDASLPASTKELLGLVASLVLRCDDCVAYHIDQCVRLGWTDEELFEAFDVGLIVGGSIVIPHLRRGVAFLDECREKIPASEITPRHS
ncbi:MAG: carboxymuconolactone decarboxylase family protein [Planctomycetota bacterium]|nr:carboxymuconolactone decarboxylase family protein [Planctomycetota bacterium]